MPTVTINGDTVNLLLTILTARRVERSREAGRWLEEPGRRTLYRHDPKETGLARHEPFDVTFTEPEMANLRDAVADAVMEVVECITRRQQRRAAGEKPGVFDVDSPGYERDVEALAAGLGIAWPDGPRPPTPTPERQRELDENRRFLDAGDLDGLIAAIRRRDEAAAASPQPTI